MTKSRARGPKRRLPTTASESNVASSQSTLPVLPKTETTDLKRAPSLSLSPPPNDPVTESYVQLLPGLGTSATEFPTEMKRVPSLGPEGTKTVPITPPKPQLLGAKTEYQPPSVSDEPEKVKSKPPTPAKSPLLSAKTDFNHSPATSPLPSPSLEKSGNLFSLDVAQNSTIPPVAAVLNNTPPERPVQPPALSWLTRRATTRAPTTQRPIRNTPGPIEQKPSESISAEPTPQPTKLPAKLPIVEDEDEVSELKPAQPISSQSNNNSGRESLGTDTIVRKVSYGSIPNFSNDLNAFFKDPELSNVKVDFDVTNFLPPRISVINDFETVKFDVWEVTGDGKVQAVETGREHILFDENMYMCLHIFEDTSGNQGAEFYLWSGNQVSRAAIDDAQIFAKKMAKESDAMMVWLYGARLYCEY